MLFEESGTHSLEEELMDLRARTGYRRQTTFKDTFELSCIRFVVQGNPLANSNSG
jgi:hypothetical protein